MVAAMKTFPPSKHIHHQGESLSQTSSISSSPIPVDIMQEFGSIQQYCPPVRRLDRQQKRHGFPIGPHGPGTGRQLPRRARRTGVTVRVIWNR